MDNNEIGPDLVQMTEPALFLVTDVRGEIPQVCAGMPAKLSPGRARTAEEESHHGKKI